METSINLTEINELLENDPEEFWEYYYWIKHLKLTNAKKMKEMEHDMKPKGQGTTVPFSKDFISNIPVEDLSDE